MTDRLIPCVPQLLGMAMIAAAAVSMLLEPRAVPVNEGLPFAQVVPRQFGDWREVEIAAMQVDPANGAGRDPNVDHPYDDVLMRAYANSHGEIVLLALAYGRNQRQEVKIHRPDVCYTAQGFELVSRSRVDLPIADTAGRRIPGTRMLVQAPGRIEAVSYWIRVGDVYTDNAWSIRYHIFAEGIKGRALDGVLVRVSQIVSRAGLGSTRQFDLQEHFLAELVQAMPASARRLLVT